MGTESALAITITRQLGCGGSHLGQRIAQRLGYAYADRQILRQAAEQLSVDPEELAGRDERVQGVWDRVFQTYSVGPPDGLYMPPPLPIVSDEQLLGVEQRIIAQLAARGRCVIVGHCAFYLLRERTDVLNVFVHAPMDFRVARVMRLYEIASPDEARRLVEKTDRERERYIHTISGCNWQEACNYHLSLDISRAGFEEAERIVVSLAGVACPCAAPPLPEQTMEDAEP